MKSPRYYVFDQMSTVHLMELVDQRFRYSGLSARRLQHAPQHQLNLFFPCFVADSCESTISLCHAHVLAMHWWDSGIKFFKFHNRIHLIHHKRQNKCSLSSFLQNHKDKLKVNVSLCCTVSLVWVEFSLFLLSQR